MSPTDFETDFNDIEDARVEKSDSTAKLAENLSKNCFLDVYPYNGNRVVLRPLQLQVESGKEVKARYRKTMDIIKELTEMTAVEPDYINASFIEGYASSKQRYIASQGPIAVTTNDFWKMVVQEKISVVVMLTEIEERGLFKQYWPDVGGQSRYGDVSVHCVKQETHADFCLRRFNVRCYDETRPVKHLQFTSWLSDGAPPTSAAMIEFYHKFLSVEPETDTPTVVHCTSGVGRTGCFIALDLCVDEGNEDHSVDVSQCVTKLREQRVNMVQSLDQYEFLYKTVTQVLSLRSYPVDKENLKKEWKDLRKENGTLIQTTFEDLCESITLDEMDIESIVKNQGEDGKNREGSDIPEDRYRPKLASGDYINAVYIDTYKKKEGMIVTQMPTPETVNQFLRLILQEQCHVAVMMNEENPDDTSQFKYWPSYDKSTQIGDVFVTTNEILDKVSYLLVKLTLSDLRRDDDTTFTLHLYQFAVWKSGDTSPKSEVACLSLIRHVLQQTDESYPGRILVHCLNGFERSGLFCALYILMEKLNYEGAISVINTVRKIKSRRANAVPNLEQFRFIYQCLVYYIENYGEEIKYKPDEQQQKRSRASSGLKRISQMYAKPDKKKKRKSELYAKPDKKKKKSQAADDRIELVTGERAASGSGVQAVYAAVDKKGKKKTDSKGETAVYDNAGYNEKGKKKSEEITVTIEHPNVNNVNDVNIVVGENDHSVVYRRE